MKRWFKKMLVFIGLLSTSIVVLFIYITYIERQLLRVNNENIILNQEGADVLKIVQFSDTHLGSFYSLDDLRRVVKKINNLEPDLVLFTGDLIDNASTYDDLFDVSDVLKEIKSSYGKYAIYGNHDIGGGAIRYYETILLDSGFRLLENESEKITINGKDINLFGGDDALLGQHDATITMEGVETGEINLLMIHEPDLIEEYQEYAVDLALSGHSHGGQVAIPIFGPLYRNLLSEKYNKGLYLLDNDRETKLYVSSGLGNTKVPFRFFNIPEINVIQLTI